MIRSLALALALVTLPSLARAEKPISRDLVLGHWVGVMVFEMNDQHYVSPVEFTFKKDGKVELLNRSGKTDRATQPWELDTKKREILFRTEKDNKPDAHIELKTLHEKSLTGQMRQAGPEDAKAPKMSLFLGRVGE